MNHSVLVAHGDSLPWSSLNSLNNCHPLFSTVVPKLTLHVLMEELKRLTKPIKFGISLDIPQEQLEVIEQDHRHGECVQVSQSYLNQ